MTKTRERVAQRSYQDHDIAAPPSPWWTIIGLGQDDMWYELYQFKSEQEADHYYGFVLDAEDTIHERFQDFAVLAPATEHAINSSVRGASRTWLESNDPSTVSRRRQQAADRTPSVRATVSKRKKA